MFSAIADAFNAILTPLYYAVSAIMLAWHWAFERLGMDPDSGWTWALSIVGLTITIRILLIPLFVKQINSSRNMQLLQPKIKELQKKYGHDRERLAQEQMKLWKDTGTNPFASCLPLILQMPIFFALFRVIDGASKKGGQLHGLIKTDDAESIRTATLLGARIASKFTDGGAIEVRVLTLALVVIMCATTFMTQRQLMSKNMPADAMTGPYAQQQKLLLYVLPFVFAIGGIAFPIGVLLYWTSSNLWTMGQQFYVIRNNPAPGTPAFDAKAARDAKHGKTKPVDPVRPDSATIVDEAPKPPPRQQPKKQTRDQRRRQARPPGSAGGTAPGRAPRKDTDDPEQADGRASA